MFEPKVNVSISVYMSSKVYKNGESPILLRMTINRKSFTKKLFSVIPSFWDGNKIKRNHTNSIKLNQLIRSSIDHAEDYVHQCKINDELISPLDYFSSGKSEKLYDVLMEKFQYMESDKKFRTAAKYKTTAKKIKEFEPNSSKYITLQWLERFQFFLRRKGNNPNTIAKDLSNIRSVTQSRVFESFKLPSQKTVKVKWSIEEIKSLYYGEYSNTVRMAVDAFVLAFNLWGARVGDVLEFKKSDIVDNILIYRTEKNEEPFKIEVNETALEIINRYPRTKYLLPYLDKAPTEKKQREKFIDKKNSSIRNNLKRAAKIQDINKPISMHIARHSFGYAADSQGLSLTDIQHILGHSSPQITSGYLKSIKSSDELNSKVKSLKLFP